MYGIVQYSSVWSITHTVGHTNHSDRRGVGLHWPRDACFVGF